MFIMASEHNWSILTLHIITVSNILRFTVVTPVLINVYPFISNKLGCWKTFQASRSLLTCSDNSVCSYSVSNGILTPNIFHDTAFMVQFCNTSSWLICSTDIVKGNWDLEFLSITDYLSLRDKSVSIRKSVICFVAPLSSTRYRWGLAVYFAFVILPELHREGIAQSVWAGWLGFNSWQGEGFLLFATSNGTGTHPASCQLGLSPVVNWPGHKADTFTFI